MLCLVIFTIREVLCKIEDENFTKELNNHFQGQISNVYIYTKPSDLFTYECLYIKIEVVTGKIETARDIQNFINQYLNKNVNTRYSHISYFIIDILDCDIADEIRFSNQYMNNRNIESLSDKQDNQIDKLSIHNYKGNMDMLRIFVDCQELIVDNINELETDSDFSMFKNLKYLEISMIDSNLHENKEIIDKIKSTMPSNCIFVDR